MSVRRTILTDMAASPFQGGLNASANSQNKQYSAFVNLTSLPTNTYIDLELFVCNYDLRKL